MKKYFYIFVAVCAITAASRTGSKTSTVESTDSVSVSIDSIPSDSIVTDSVIVEDGDTIGLV